MGRLFIGPREQNFISDITKELIHDVIGEPILIYPISYTKSNVHDVYEESVTKIADNPISLNALISWATSETKTTKFGTETVRVIEIYIQQKDLLDRKINIMDGDFVSYGSTYFEIVARNVADLVFGQIEHGRTIKIVGKEARRDLFYEKVQGRLQAEHGGKQIPFVQSRGQDENVLGKTNDQRSLLDKKIIDQPITGPKEVSEHGDDTGAGGSFYGE